MLVEDFIDEFRDRIGDTSQSVSDQSIISFMNTALRRLARTDGMEKLFGRRDSFELASINADGTATAGWDLGKVGHILDIPNIKMLCAGSAGVHRIPLRFMDFNKFFDIVTVPEQCAPGIPEFYTIEQIGGINRLLFNRPPKSLVALEMVYSAFHTRITGIDDTLMIAYEYADIITEYVIILHKIETTDMSTGRALYEDLDLLVTQTVDLLAKNKKGTPYKRVVRSF